MWLACIVVPSTESSNPRLVAALEAHRAAFSTTLVGTWTSAAGTFDAIANERWEFQPDGVVVVTFHGRLGTTTDEYRWQSVGPFRIRIGIPGDDGEPAAWSVVDYAFGIVTHDAGTEVALHEVGCRGFWSSDSPLRSESGPSAPAE